MNASSYNDPQFIPTVLDGCPPTSATEVRGFFFRLVTESPPSADDFKTGPEKRGQKKKCRQCQAAGLSIYADASDARAKFAELFDRFGEGIKLGRYIARLSIDNSHGRLRNTHESDENSPPTNSHHTWWPYAVADRLSSFVEIEEDAHNALDT